MDTGATRARLTQATAFGEGCKTGDGKCIVTAEWETKHPPVPNGDFRLHSGVVRTQGPLVTVNLGPITPASEGVGPDPAAIARSGKPQHFSSGAVHIAAFKQQPGQGVGCNRPSSPGRVMLDPTRDRAITLAGLVPRLHGHAERMPAQALVSCRPSDTGEIGTSTCTLYAAGQSQPFHGRPERAFDGSPSWNAYTERPLPHVDGLPGFQGKSVQELASPDGRYPHVPTTIGDMVGSWSR